jgi:predicted MPP superfamily phosphohydrolase
MNLFFIIFFTLYTLINSYVFIRGWQALSYLPFLKPFFIIIFLLFSFSYIFVKILAEKLPAIIHDPLLWIGSFWFALLLYFVLILFLIDLMRLLDHFISFLPLWLSAPTDLMKLYIGTGVTVLVLLITTAGFINRANFKVKTLEMTLPKKNSTLTGLNIVMFSDLHLSPVNDEAFLNKIVEKVNVLNPDIILLPGDIVDDKAEILKRNCIGSGLKKLKSKYGVFASTGNHEFINGVESSVNFAREFSVTVLRDEFMKVDNLFYIIGREDVSKNSFTKQKRKRLNEILSGMQENLPVILLDHTPVKLNEAVENKIDLQLSGHTHNGQMFPLNFITNLIYEVSWGYLKKENTHFYVSSGVGSWGPPVKLASDAEIVNLKIKFI